MARVTVEDCIDKVSNRFELVMLAAHRAREISAGMPMTVEEDNDKNPVIALREIAEETVKPDEVRESLIRGLQKHVDFDEPEPEDDMEFLPAAAEPVAAEPVAAEAVAAEAEVTAPEEAPAADEPAADDAAADDPAADDQAADDQAADDQAAGADPEDGRTEG